MHNRNSLRRRIIVSYISFCALICAVFVTIFKFAEEYVEDELIYTRLAAELERQIRNHRQGIRLEPLAGVTFFIADEIPGYLRHLPTDGLAHEVDVNGHELTALLRQEEAVTYAIAAGLERFELIEFAITLALAVATLASLLLSYGFAYGILNRVIAPLRNLTRKVETGTLQKADAVASEDEIGILAKAILDRDAELSRFISRERLFTGDVSHELRTPLTIILGGSEVLASRLSADAKAMEYIERIRYTARDTSERVTALLLLSRSPDAISARQSDLTLLVEKEIDRHRYLLEGKAVSCKLSLECDSTFFVRPELAAIAFGNLIRNAFQYTEEGAVAIGLTAAGFVISDTGCGVPEAIQEHLFERFVRGDSNVLSGSGLGLSIVMRVCEHVGWKLRYQPRASGGSEFSIHFYPEGSAEISGDFINAEPQ